MRRTGVVKRFKAHLYFTRENCPIQTPTQTEPLVQGIHVLGQGSLLKPVSALETLVVLVKVYALLFQDILLEQKSLF